MKNFKLILYKILNIILLISNNIEVEDVDLV